MNKKGFTLIELLIVVVIIGILAAIAIPKFGESRERAYVSAMQSDMNQLRTAMEMCYQDSGFTYVGCDETLINASTGVNLTVAAQSTTQYTIAATHDATANWTCAYDHTGGATPGVINTVSKRLSRSRDAGAGLEVGPRSFGMKGKSLESCECGRCRLTVSTKAIPAATRREARGSC
jgi:prepilin-type N-terminal cleavage/methylation domain-containing protein